MSWKDDLALRNQLEIYVRQNLKRLEVLDFVNRDYSYHFQNGQCSLRTLCRILKHFNITYQDYSVSAERIVNAVKAESRGSGKDLGYRAMTAKVRQKHGMAVPRDIVYAAMVNVDHEAVKRRRPGIKRKKRNGHYVTEGVNWFLSIDGHDKMMGYQNSTFPIAIYGMLDQASRKIVLLKCWTSNSDPRIVGRWYIELLRKTKVLPSNVRMDRGTETGVLAAIHTYLRAHMGDLDDPLDSIVYGPSTSNQVSYFSPSFLLPVCWTIPLY